jgi:cation transport regulator ChaB
MGESFVAGLLAAALGVAWRTHRDARGRKERARREEQQAHLLMRALHTQAL